MLEPVVKVIMFVKQGTQATIGCIDNIGGWRKGRGVWDDTEECRPAGGSWILEAWVVIALIKELMLTPRQGLARSPKSSG
jgi:hypothetical protein